MIRLNGNSFIFFFLVFPLFYFLSFLLVSLYVNGDQIHYRAFYEAISVASFSEAFLLARVYIDAGEPLTIFLLWAGSVSGVSKDLYISFFNAIFLTQIVFLLKKYRAGPLVIFLLLTNFYVVVLLTGAERLKFAYILLASAVLLNGYAKNALVLLAPLAHFQSFLFLPSVFLARFYEEIRTLFAKGVVGKRALFVSLSALVFIFILVAYLYPSLEKKLQSYFDVDRGGLVLVNLIALTLVAVFASRDWKRMLLLLLPCYPIVLVLGGERGNMVAITIALWVLMVERKMNHPAVLMMLAYFSWKSIGFVVNIIEYGNGFAFSHV